MELLVVAILLFLFGLSLYEGLNYLYREFWLPTEYPNIPVTYVKTIYGGTAESTIYGQYHWESDRIVCRADLPKKVREHVLLHELFHATGRHNRLNRLPGNGNVWEYNILAPLALQTGEDKYQQLWTWVEEAVVERAIALYRGEEIYFLAMAESVAAFKTFTYYYELIAQCELSLDQKEKIIVGIEVEAQKVVNFHRNNLV